MAARSKRDDGVDAEVKSLLRRLEQGLDTKAGFPGADDVDYSPLWPLLDFELNNIGDPYDLPAFDHHTKPYEQVAVDWFADLFGLPQNDRWGYVTTGSTECLQYGLLRARQIYPDGITYYSEAAHYKVGRVLDDFRMTKVAVPAAASGEISYSALHEAVAANPRVPAVIVATAGTTMTEAVDDLGRIDDVLNDLGVLERYVHVDAALAAVPLGLMDESARPRFDFRSGADSLGFSTHKFLATRMPGGVVLTRRSAPRTSQRKVEYTGAADTVMTCSRNGHLAMMVWYCVQTLGREGLRRRANAARDAAAYLVERLKAIGWRAWRHPWAFTVVMDTPPIEVAQRWHLATEDGRSHYICMPGRDREQADEFVGDLRRAISTGVAAPPKQTIRPLANLAAMVRKSA